MATRIKQTMNMVDEWPEGKEWKFESKVKKLKPKESSKFVWLGLGLPTICLRTCVTIPTTKI